MPRAGPDAAGSGAEQSFAATPGRRDLLVVVHSFFPADPRIRKQVHAAVAAGYTVDVLCLEGEGQRAREEMEGVRIRRLPVRRDRGRGVVGYLLEYLAFAALALGFVGWLHLRYRYRVAHVHNMPDALVLAALVPRLTGARVVLDIHDFMPELIRTRYDLPPSHALVRLLNALEALSCRFAHVVVTTHERGRRRLLERGVANDKVVVIMNTAPMHEPPPGRRAPEGDFTLIYHGLLSDVYDLDSAVTAVAALRDRGRRRVRLWLVGDGPRTAHLRRLVAELGLEDRVAFEGWVEPERVPGLLARADAGFAVLHARPHQQIALPTKMFEAIAHGLPVITSRTLVTTDILGEDDVVFVPAGQPAQLAEAIQRLADDPQHADALARNAWRALWPLRWQVMADRYVALLAAAAGLPAGTAR